MILVRMAGRIRSSSLFGSLIGFKGLFLLYFFKVFSLFFLDDGVYVSNKN